MPVLFTGGLLAAERVCPDSRRVASNVPACFCWHEACPAAFKAALQAAGQRVFAGWLLAAAVECPTTCVMCCVFGSPRRGGRCVMFYV